MEFLFVYAETGKIIDVNPFLCELLAYSKENFIDKKLWQIGLLQQDIAANKEKFLELQKKGYVRYGRLTAGNNRWKKNKY
ncbi:MAG: PAS domain-containing protein [Melioribacteraceae bacterium]|nr:PAS domain-containing protein [Melioribacteraceae bacterium]